MHSVSLKRYSALSYHLNIHFDVKNTQESQCPYWEYLNMLSNIAYTYLKFPKYVYLVCSALANRSNFTVYLSCNTVYIRHPKKMVIDKKTTWGVFQRNFALLHFIFIHLKYEFITQFYYIRWLQAAVEEQCLRIIFFIHPPVEYAMGIVSTTSLKVCLVLCNIYTHCESFCTRYISFCWYLWRRVDGCI